jgi:hypothetical protein
MAFFTEAHLHAIAQHPHLLGHVVGKTKLTEQHSEWIKYCWRSKINRALQGHRGSYKTTAIAEVGAIVNMLFRPDDRIAIIRKTFTAAASVVKTISIMMQQPEIIELFTVAHGFAPKAITNKEGLLLFNFKRTVTPEGSITAHGLDYGMTGQHYDRILLDDFVTQRDRVSKAERDKSKEVVQEIITNIIDPGQPISLIGTPWHTNDAWNMKNDDGKLILPEPLKFNVYETGILTPDEIKMKKGLITPVLFAANYELVHQSDDKALFKDPTFAPWNLTVKQCKGQLDAAFDGDHFCALTFMAKLPSGRYQAVGYTYTGNVKDWLHTVASLYKKYRCEYIYIEDNADKGYTADALEKLGVRCRRYQEHENKHIKITTHGYRLWGLTDWDSETDDEYLEQCIDYRAGQEPDDACLVAETMVLTLNGNKPIKKVKVGDAVWTPFGFRKVLFSGCTGEKEVFDNGIIQGTFNHKIYNQIDNRFQALDSFTCINSYDILSLRSMILWQITKECFLMEFGIQKQRRDFIISLKAYQIKTGKILNNCTKLFMNFIQDRKFKKGFIFTIKILIGIIMSFLIWSYFRLMGIFHCTPKGILNAQNLGRQPKNKCKRTRNWQKNGIKVQKGKSGIGNILLNLWGKLGEIKGNGFVRIVIKNIRRIFIHKNSVQSYVGHTQEAKPTESLLSVNIVGKSYRLEKDLNQHKSFVQKNATMQINGKKEKVYNLTIKDAGCFYANGVLVSNCDSFASLGREAFNPKGDQSELWKFH